MSNIIIYTTEFCPYCVHVKRLLNHKNIEFTEIDVGKEPRKRAEMMQKSQRTTVPQIFNGTIHIGDCTELYGFESAGELDVLLA
ncbi:MAG TPA: glutaredoxin 3 [Cycloclasticus sp.]|jgi:glutaredoxin 3|nr:glutaredoxin 3 [Cycloclasticus sp.]